MRTSGIKTNDWKSKQEYKAFYEYWWHDPQFNLIYNNWKKSQINTNTFYDLLKPSIDHKIPKSRNGDNTIENLQFLTVFENLVKRDMTWDEW